MRSRLIGGMLLLSLSGCGEPYKVGAVSGKVTRNDKPLAGVQVTFQPVGSGNLNPGPGSRGLTDAEGCYPLRLLGPDRPGAVVGKHRVMIFTYRPGGGKEEKAVAPETIPAWFNVESKLFFTVPPEGTETAD